MRRLGITAFVFVLGMATGEIANAQVPSGNDVNTAIPIYFGQIVNDLGDSATAPERVYSITLAKGQKITATLSVANTAPNTYLNVTLYPPGTASLAGCGYGCYGSSIAAAQGRSKAATYSYTASTPGIYYVKVGFGDVGVSYMLQVTAQGTPLNVPNPAQAGCVTGPVDYITYSLQLIAAGLPDEASVAGTKLCASCTVKPPAYVEVVEKFEKAMGLNLNVSACYDASGSIFQVTLKHP